MKLSVIIPVYNEIDTIDEVLKRVRAVDVDKEIIATDDCSTDGTREFLRTQPDIKLLENPTNLGKGAGIRQALAAATGDIIIIQDADLEYNPQDYHAMIAPIERGEADIVYGTRFIGARPKMKLANFIANKVFALMASVLYRRHITDEATCYKAFRADVIKNLDLHCSRFEFCPEVTGRLLKRDYRYAEVPISYYPRTHAQGKKITWQDGIECIWTLIKYRFTG